MLNSSSHKLEKQLMAVLCASVGLALTHNSAQAASMFFDDEATFFDNAGLLAVESFEDSPVTGVASVSTITVDDFTIATDGGSTLLGVIDQATNRFPTDGTQFVAYNSNPVAEPFTITFDNQLTAFGVNITDLEQDLTITTSNGDTTTLPAGSDGNLKFLGIVSDTSFTSVNFSIAQTNEGIGIDEVYYTATNGDNGDNTTVPEPSSFVGVLLALGLGRLLIKHK